jgi:Peptidase family S41
VGDTPIGEVIARALQLTPADENAPMREALALRYAAMGVVLHGQGVIPERHHASYRLQTDGGEAFTLDLPSTPRRIDAGWLKPYQELPLCEQRPDEPFWCVPIPGSKAVYCDFRAYDGLGGRARAMRELIRRTSPERVVIDLRDNEGGDYTVGQAEVIEPLQRLTSINRKGHLFVLIGAETFSAAMNNAAQFHSMTAATLVGESIGEKPNSYQEPRELTLPNSHLVVRYSTEWYAFAKTGPNSVDPDVRVVPTWAQYASGQDPVLDSALSAPPTP